MFFFFLIRVRQNPVVHHQFPHSTAIIFSFNSPKLGGILILRHTQCEFLESFRWSWHVNLEFWVQSHWLCWSATPSGICQFLILVSMPCGFLILWCLRPHIRCSAPFIGLHLQSVLLRWEPRLLGSAAALAGAWDGGPTYGTGWRSAGCQGKLTHFPRDAVS